MPNHCYQQVFLEGPREIMSEIYNSLTYQQPQFLQLICPTPIELFKTNHNTNGSYDIGWYDWRIENWGTKWDVSEVEIIETSWDADGTNLPDSITGMPVQDVVSINFNCWTAWGPPTPVWEKLKELGVLVDADYQDEGGMFEGTWLDGVGDSWNPEEGEDVEDDQ